MREIRVPVYLLLLALMLVAAANANGAIYRWVDENGRVQYGDRPPPEVEASDEIAMPREKAAAGKSSKENSSEDELTPVDRKKARRRLLEQYQREREEKKEAATKKRKEKQQRKARCHYAKSRLSTYLETGSLYRRAPNQERSYLSDQERDAVVARARAEVKRWCKK